MNSKYIFSVSLVLVSLLLFTACQDDPTFPDPGFELEDQEVEVRRDTADYYNVSMQMDVPNGVDYIEVLNATNYELIETVEDYSGKTKFVFNYDIDLRSFEKDTVLYYLFKVTDKDSRSTNRGFTLSVKRFSFPEIRLVGGTTLNVVVPVYEIQGIVSTGLNELESVQVLFKGQEQFFYVAEEDTVIYEYILSELIGFGTLVQGEEYDLDIVIKDRKGQIGTTSVKVRKSEGLKKPVGLNIYNYLNVNSYMTFEYDEQNRMVFIDFTWENGSTSDFYFSYNEQGVIDTVRKVRRYESDYYNEYGYSHNSMVYKYKEGTTQLEEILRYDVFYHDNGTIEITEDNKVESYGFEYDERGVLTSFVGKNEIIYLDYADPFGTGESVFYDYWQNYRYYEIKEENRQHRTGFQPIYMPTYIEGFPPFFTLGSVEMRVFCIVFYNKYLFTGTQSSSSEYSGSYLYEPNFTYETDTEGNVLNLTESYLYNGWQHRTNVYTFDYE